MLTHEKICETVREVAADFPLTKVSYFGSYAEGRPRETSDLDLLVEFAAPAVSLFKIIALKQCLEEKLGTEVDVIHAPLPDDSFLDIQKTILAYAA